MVKKKRLKLRKQGLVLIGGFAILIGLIIFFIINLNQNGAYQEKLLNIGYTKEEAELLQKKLKSEDIDRILNMGKNSILIDVLNHPDYQVKYGSDYLKYLTQYKKDNANEIIRVINLYSKYQNKLKDTYSEEEMLKISEELSEKEIETLTDKSKDNTLIQILYAKYYLKKNLKNYLDYASKNKNTSIDEVVAMVNTHRYDDYYENVIDTDISKGTILLVNKYFYLPENYEPDDLVNISNEYYYGSNHKMRKVAYDAFKNMWNAAYKENIYLIINSSYRSYASQKEVYEQYKAQRGTEYADSIAARPGHSEHQTGLSLDIFSKDNTNAGTFKDSKAYEWLTNHAHEYGFIQRYQSDKVNITGFSEETWHWRYVGTDIATYIHDNDITFDEYYAYFLEK